MTASVMSSTTPVYVRALYLLEDSGGGERSDIFSELRFSQLLYLNKLQRHRTKVACVVIENGRREERFLTARCSVRNDDRLATRDTDLDTAIRLPVPRLRLPAVQFHTWYGLFPGELREPAQSVGRSIRER